MKKLLILYPFLLFCLISKADNQLKLTNWEIKSTTEISENAEKVSMPSFQATDWYEATVPTTVLNALVKQNVYPDPRIGMNNFLIPDVSDEFNKKMDLAKYSYLGNGKNPWQEPYWYRTTFTLPKQYKNKKIWLNLNGINYRADVWINGHQIGKKEDVVGMFRRFKFDITDYIQPTQNCIAIKIYQVDHPGTPNPGTQFIAFGPNRGTASDLFKDETLKFTGGWDCAPVVRDRNMGIYQSVTLEATSQVTIEDPYIITTLPQKDTTVADITIKATVHNHSDKMISGKVKATIRLINELVYPSYTRKLAGSMKPISVTLPVTMLPNESKEIILSPQKFSVLSIQNPYLWYPNGYGEQYMHSLDLSFDMNNGKSSDREKVNFGIREVTSELMKNGEEYGRVFFINGKRIFCKGGWIQPDVLLDDSPKRIYDQARLMANANITLIGSEDMPSPSEDWLDSWDKYGLMNWHVFYQCYRMFPGRDNQHNPLNNDLAIACVKDMVKRYRNHPCIIAWFGVNEVLVDEELYHPTKEAVLSLDTTRPYIPTTSISWDVDKLTPYLKPDLPTGTTDDGAPDYNWAPSDYYFDKVEEVYLQMFRNELGMPSVPVYESLKKFIPTIDKPLDRRNPIYPLDSIWAEHGAWDTNNFCYRAYDNAIRTFYSDPVSSEDYAYKGQLVSSEGYRAMFEAANHRMWDITTGIMIWKLNSCWPDVCWQIYDWYLSPNASYYFSKKAMEPIHIQMNANTNRISVLNNDLAIACVKDMVKRYRNHPCIIAWFGVNEVLVDEELYHPTKEAVLSLDTTRPYIPTTSISWDVDKLTPYLKPDLPTGTTDDGAPDYNWAPSDYYFDKVEEVYLQMFRNELGMPSVPVYESLKKFIPTIDKPLDRRNPIYPLDSIWAEHGAWDTNNFCYRAYDNAIRTFYSDPVSSEDYAYKGQLVSSEGYRAMFEAANHRMWDITTGIMIWKLNSCWPDVCWQIYDWYLSPNASYYFSKKAMEPIHIQMNANTNRISVINATHQELKSVVAKARIIDYSMKECWAYTDTISVGADQYKELETVPQRGDLSAVYYIKLELEDLNGNLISENLYWRYSQHQNFYWLVNMPKVTLKQDLKLQKQEKEYQITLTLTNDSDKLSFFNHLMIQREKTKEVVNPVFWSDNFISLFPNETRTITATVSIEDLHGENPIIIIK